MTFRMNSEKPVSQIDSYIDSGEGVLVIRPV